MQADALAPLVERIQLWGYEGRNVGVYEWPRVCWKQLVHVVFEI